MPDINGDILRGFLRHLYVDVDDWSDQEVALEALTIFDSMADSFNGNVVRGRTCQLKAKKVVANYRIEDIECFDVCCNCWGWRGGSCSVVEGVIHPMGACDLWQLNENLMGGAEYGWELPPIYSVTEELIPVSVPPEPEEYVPVQLPEEEVYTVELISRNPIPIEQFEPLPSAIVNGGISKERLEPISSKAPDGITKRLMFGEDSADRIKRVMTWNGLELGITHEPGDKRHDRVLTAAYGHVRGTYGQADDGMAYDVWVGPALDNQRVWKIKQLTFDGQYDEAKFIIGVKSKKQAKDLYLDNMPEQLFGGIQQVQVSDLKPKKREDAQPWSTSQVAIANLGIKYSPIIEERLGLALLLLTRSTSLEDFKLRIPSLYKEWDRTKSEQLLYQHFLLANLLGREEVIDESNPSSR